MMISPCRLVVKDGKANWCDSGCNRYHVGHYAALAVDPGEMGQKFRELWRGVRKKISDYTVDWPAGCPYLGAWTRRTRLVSQSTGGG